MVSGHHVCEGSWQSTYWRRSLQLQGRREKKKGIDFFFRTDLAHHFGGPLPIEKDIEASNMMKKWSILQGCDWRVGKKMMTNVRSLFWSSSSMGNRKSTSEMLLCFCRWSLRISNQFLAKKLESLHTRSPSSLTVKEIVIIHGNSLEKSYDR